MNKLASNAVNRLSRLLSTHLLSAVTISFALGISFALACDCPLGQIFLLPLCIGGYALFAHLRKHPQATLLLLFFIASLGLVHGLLSGREPLSPHHIFQQIQEEQEVVLLGTLERLPGFNGENSTLVVKAHSLRLKEGTGFMSAHGLTQLRLKGPWPQELLPGDQLAIRAKLDRPYTFRNPGSFDYPTFLARQGIWITGRISSPLHIYRLPPDFTLWHQARYLPEQLRTKISSFLEQTSSPEVSAVYKALLIGDASGISPEIVEVFKKSGCMHILSISGAHLSILATFIFFSLYWLLRRSESLVLRYPVKKIAAALCLAPLTIYTLLAGANTPVVRSLIMVTVFMVALCADKRKSLFTPLALAALIILIWDPNSLFTASFQLSFMAVASIALVAPYVAGQAAEKKSRKEATLGHRLKNRLLSFTLAGLSVSVAATLSTAPLLLYYFNQFSLIGPVANLFVETLICFWSLPLGFLACPLIFVAPPAAALLLHLGDYGLILSLKAATFFSDLPLSTLWLPTPSPTLIVLYYAAILIALSGIVAGKRAVAFGVGSWALILLLFFLTPAEILKSWITTSEITFLDVGQGSATFLQLPSGKRLLIDGGGSESPGFNVGEDIIAPFLWQKGIRRLDGIVITHADTDHYNGIPFLLQRFRPDVVWVSDLAGHDKAYHQMLKDADRLGIPVKIPQEGERLITSGGAELVNLGNPEEPEGTKSNDRSLILRFGHVGSDNLSCLFAGDISDKAEARLVTANIPLQSSLLLSPHHGSSTSNSEIFLKAVNPKTIVVSAGRFRPDNFPALEVRQRCEELGIKMLITAEQGGITVTDQNVILPGKGKLY